MLRTRGRRCGSPRCPHMKATIELHPGRVSSLPTQGEEMQYYFRTSLRIIANEGRENNPALISDTSRPVPLPCLCPRKGFGIKGLDLLDRWPSLWIRLRSQSQPRRTKARSRRGDEGPAGLCICGGFSRGWSQPPLQQQTGSRAPCPAQRPRALSTPGRLSDAIRLCSSGDRARPSAGSSRGVCSGPCSGCVPCPA